MRNVLAGLASLLIASSSTATNTISIGKKTQTLYSEVHKIVMQDGGLKNIQYNNYSIEIDAQFCPEEKERHLKVTLRKRDEEETPILCFCDGHEEDLDNNPDLFLLWKTDPITGEKYPREYPMTRERIKECDKIMNTIYPIIKK